MKLFGDTLEDFIPIKSKISVLNNQFEDFQVVKKIAQYKLK